MSKHMKKAVAVLMLLGIAAAVAMGAEVAPGVQFHGYMQNRVYAAPGAQLEFRSERISISAAAALPEQSNAYVELYYHPWAPTQTSGIYLESAYYDTKAGEGRLRIGKGRRQTFGITPAYPNRKTSNYGIVCEAFTQDRIQGVQYMLQKGVLDCGIALHTGYRLGYRNIGEIPGDSDRNVTHQVPHLAFRDASSGGGSPSRLNSKPEVSARLGGKWDGGIKAGISLSVGRLDDKDLANLNGVGPLASDELRPTNPITGVKAPYLLPTATSKSRRVWGLDFTAPLPHDFVAQGEFYKAKVSDLKYKAWNLLAGYAPTGGWKFFARYGKQDMDMVPNDNPLSWDVKQLSISAVQPLRKGLWIQYEYERNSESPPVGAGTVKNAVFFVELFSGF